MRYNVHRTARAGTYHLLVEDHEHYYKAAGTFASYTQRQINVYVKLLKRGCQVYEEIHEYGSTKYDTWRGDIIVA